MVRSKADVTTAELGDEYVMMGPYNESTVRLEVEVGEPDNPIIQEVVGQMRSHNVKVRKTKRYAVSGNRRGGVGGARRGGVGGAEPVSAAEDGYFAVDTPASMLICGQLLFFGSQFRGDSCSPHYMHLTIFPVQSLHHDTWVHSVF